MPSQSTFRISVVVAALLAAFGGVGRAQEPNTLESLVDLGAAIILRPDRPGGELRFRIDASAKRLALLAAATGVEVAVTIIDPEGAEINPQNIAARGGSFQFAPNEKKPEKTQGGGDFLMGFGMPTGDYMYIFDLPVSLSGSYRIRAAAQGPVSEPAYVIVMPLSEGPDGAVRPERPFEAECGPHDREFQAGAAIRFTCKVESLAVPVAGAKVVVAVEGPGVAVSVVLLDNGVAPDSAAGDGVYSGSFTPPSAGDYRLRSSISATTSEGRTESANDGWAFQVEAATASLTGRVASRGVDANQDGRFEQLAVDVEVDVREAGQYGVRAFVGNPAARQSSPYAVAMGTRRLDRGVHQLTAPIDIVGALPPATTLDVLAEYGKQPVLSLAGQRQIDRVELWSQQLSETAGDIQVLDGSRSAERTRAHGQALARRMSLKDVKKLQTLHDAGDIPSLRPEQIALPPVTVGRLTDRAVDEDGDGQFDALIVSVPVRLRAGVTVERWVVTLRQVSFEWVYGPVTADEAVLEARFPGITIAAGGVNGPHEVSLSIETSHGTLHAAEAGTTQAYLATQFDQAEPRIVSIEPAQGAQGEYLSEVTLELHDVSSRDKMLRIEIEGVGRGLLKATAEGRFATGITVHPQARPGPHDVKVSVGDRVLTLPGAFTVVASSGRP